MYAVSNAFLSALQESTLQVVVQVTTNNGIALNVVNGNVSMDAQRSITRTCSLEIAPSETQTVDDLFNLLMSPSLEIQVKRGLVINGSAEFVPLGLFSTDTVEVSKSVAGTLSWSGSDRSKKISRSKFIEPYQIAAGSDLATAGNDLLVSRWEQVVTNFGNVTDTVTGTLLFDGGADTNPWEVARTLFADYGYDLHFDGLGTARAVLVPDPATEAPVFSFGSGSTNLVTDGSLSGSLEDVYNGVVATGEGSAVTTPIRAEVWDTDPTSPTYFQSGFGKVPYFYSSPLLTTLEAAEKAAQTRLSKVKGRSQKLAWPAIVNPALEPLDIVSVTFNGKTTIAVLDSLTIPLKASEAMSAVAREVSIA